MTKELQSLGRSNINMLKFPKKASPKFTEMEALNLGETRILGHTEIH